MSTSSKNESVKDLAQKLWADLGSVEITNMEDIKTGRTVTPIINAAFKDVIVATIKACANEIDTDPGGMDGCAGMLRTLATKISRSRYHKIYPDCLGEKEDDDEE